MFQEKGFSPLVFLVLGVLLLGGVTLGAYFIKQERGQTKILNIHSFDDCVKAGYPVLLTYPEQCVAPDGKNYIKPTPLQSMPPNPQVTGIISNPPDRAVPNY